MGIGQTPALQSPAAQDAHDPEDAPRPWLQEIGDEENENTDSPGYPTLTEISDRGLLAEVVSVVKSGKEATVYCCRTPSRSGDTLVAAKVYRERANRSFQNDAVYWAGIPIGRRRERLAFQKKTRVGRELQASRWPAREYETLSILHAAGADVPEPIMVAGGVLLMEFFGDERGAAPQLQHVTLTRDEAAVLYRRVLDNVALWLAHHRIHADLSAFNILYWQGTVKVIDFPQAVDPRQNPNAWDLLQRDLENVHRYFARYGIEGDPAWLTHDLRRQYLDPTYRP
jgi:RIO kinase 1